jgi:hypothetical protein
MFSQLLEHSTAVKKNLLHVAALVTGTTMKAAVQTMLAAAAALAVAAGERGTPTNPTFIHSGTPGERKEGCVAVLR